MANIVRDFALVLEDLKDVFFSGFLWVKGGSELDGVQHLGWLPVVCSHVDHRWLDA